MNRNYFLCGLNLKNKPCLAVGDSPEIVQKAQVLARAGGKLKLISPQLTRKQEISLNRAKVRWIKKIFKPSDVKNFSLVFLEKEVSPTLVRAVYKECQKQKIWVCTLDQPQYCDVVNVSVFEKGLLKIGISTGGAAPSVSRKIRLGLEESLQKSQIDRYLKKLLGMRTILAKKKLGPGEKRKKLLKATDGFQFRVQVKIPQNKI